MIPYLSIFISVAWVTVFIYIRKSDENTRRLTREIEEIIKEKKARLNK